MAESTSQTCYAADNSIAIDRTVLVELRRAAVQEMRAIDAFLKGRIDVPALQRELRRVELTRERAVHA